MSEPCMLILSSYTQASRDCPVSSRFRGGSTTGREGLGEEMVPRYRAASGQQQGAHTLRPMGIQASDSLCLGSVSVLHVCRSWFGRSQCLHAFLCHSCVRHSPM